MSVAFQTTLPGGWLGAGRGSERLTRGQGHLPGADTQENKVTQWVGGALSKGRLRTWDVRGTHVARDYRGGAGLAAVARLSQTHTPAPATTRRYVRIFLVVALTVALKGPAPALL